MEMSMIKWIITRKDGGAMYTKWTKRNESMEIRKTIEWMGQMTKYCIAALLILSTRTVNHSTPDTINYTSDDNANANKIILSQTNQKINLNF